MIATSIFRAADGHDYELLPDALGGGDQGAVSLGRRCSDYADVAIKRIVGGADREPAEGEDPHNRELRIALRLGESPRHLIAPQTWATDGNDLLLVMPRATHSLAEELAQHPSGMPEDDVLRILRDLTTGLAELCDAGIVHRDLKPANLLLRNGQWHVADFGISRDLSVSTGTTTYQLWGAQLYWAPERFRVQRATHKSDLYALGCIGYELLTGTAPFHTVDEHLHHPPAPIPASAPMSRWLIRMLAKDPARRHQDAHAALAALPTSPAATAGPLAQAALQHAQRQQRKDAEQAQRDTEVEAKMALRVQAQADLDDICAGAFESARHDVPDLAWTTTGGSNRFRIEDVELVFIVWHPPFGDYHGAISGGYVSADLNGDRRTVANIVYESDSQGRLTWYIETFTRNAAAGIVGEPRGFEGDTEYFTVYGLLRQGGVAPWDRQSRHPLTADDIVALLTTLLTDAPTS